MTGIRDMVKRNVALYQVYQYASGWFSKGVLTQEDLEEIQRLYEEKETSVEETPIEETVVEENTVTEEEFLNIPSSNEGD